MISTNGLLVEQAKIVQGLAPITPSSSVPDYVSLKNYERCTIIIEVDNGATVTASAITVQQATAVANTGEKALSLSRVWANEDTANSDTLTETTVVSNTFDTDNTDNRNLQYVIEIDSNDLDVANSYDCVRLGTGNAANTVLSATYILWPAKYAKSTPPAAITD